MTIGKTHLTLQVQIIAETVISKKSSLADEVCVGHVRNKNGYDDIHAFISSSNQEKLFQGEIFQIFLLDQSCVIPYK